MLTVANKIAENFDNYSLTMTIELNCICKSWGETQVLKNISFRCDAGGNMVLLGPSGAGKSLLLRVLNLLNEPEHGCISIVGESFEFTQSQKNLAKRGQC